MSRNLFFAVALIWVPLLLIACLFGPASAQQDRNSANLVLYQEKNIPVFLQPEKLDVLSSEISGYITQINYRPQQFVKEGDVVVQLDPRLYELEIEWIKTQIELNTGIEEAEIVEQFSKKNLEIIEELYAEKVAGVAVGSPKELYDAQQRYRLAQLESQKARLKLEELNYNLRRNQYLLDKTSIRAPFDGVIVPFSSVNGVPAIPEGLKAFVEGEVVQAFSPVSAIMKVDQMQIGFSLYLDQIDQVRLGSKALIYVQNAPDTPLKGEVVFISPTVSSTGQFDLKIEFENPPREKSASAGGVYHYRFRPGMRAVRVELLPE